MGQRIRRLRQWTRAYLPDVPMKENLLKLCDKRKRWLAHIDFPQAFRTSATLDRLMKFMERHAIAAQMFHSDHQKTTQNIRAYALLYNFTPSCPAVVGQPPHADQSGRESQSLCLSSQLVAKPLDRHFFGRILASLQSVIVRIILILFFKKLSVLACYFREQTWNSSTKCKCNKTKKDFSPNSTSLGTTPHRRQN